MGVIRNIKNSIDDKSSMSVGSITLLMSAMIGAIIGLVVCFVLIWDVTTNGYIKTDLLDLGIFLMSGGAYIAGSGIPKTIVDSRLKLKAGIANDDIEEEAEERRRRRKNKKSEDDLTTDDEDKTDNE